MEHRQSGPSNTHNAGALRIFLLEDDAVNTAIFVGFLEQWGPVGVTAVTRVKDAEAQQDKMLAGDFDLVVLDRMLPDGESLDLARALVGHLPCPLAAYTARTLAPDLLVLDEIGFDHVFHKPLKRRVFTQGIETLLH